MFTFSGIMRDPASPRPALKCQAKTSKPAESRLVKNAESAFAAHLSHRPQPVASTTGWLALAGLVRDGSIVLKDEEACPKQSVRTKGSADDRR